MRQFIFIMIISTALSTTIGITSLKAQAPEGTWIPVKQEFAGKELPTASFVKQMLIISDSTYTLIAESLDKGSVIYNDNKMDIYGIEGVNAGKHFTAIFKLEDGQLTICYDLAGDSYPETFETKDHPMYFMSVFEKDNTQ